MLLQLWGVQALALAAILVLYAALKEGNADLPDYVLPLFMLGYFFYPTFGGNQYGPRFYYEAYPFVIISVVRALFRDNQVFLPKQLLRPTMGMLFLGVCSTLLHLPWICSFESHVVRERSEVFRLTNMRKLVNALVLIEDAIEVQVKQGFVPIMQVSDLTRNGVALDGSVLYAAAFPFGSSGDKKSIRSSVDVLKRYFPHRSFYRYFRAQDSKKRQVKGHLELIE